MKNTPKNHEKPAEEKAEQTGISFECEGNKCFLLIAIAMICFTIIIVATCI